VPLQRAIQLGHLPSRALLAWIFMFAREGIAKNRNTAIELVQEGARLGCHHCQGVLAFCLWQCHITHVMKAGGDRIIDVEEPPPQAVQKWRSRAPHGAVHMGISFSGSWWIGIRMSLKRWVIFGSLQSSI
jgi:hypothetical protein